MAKQLMCCLIMASIADIVMPDSANLLSSTGFSMVNLDEMMGNFEAKANAVQQEQEQEQEQEQARERARARATNRDSSSATSTQSSSSSYSDKRKKKGGEKSRPPLEDDPTAWGSRDLKTWLTDHSVDFTHAIEKRDLVGKSPAALAAVEIAFLRPAGAVARRAKAELGTANLWQNSCTLRSPAGHNHHHHRHHHHRCHHHYHRHHHHRAAQTVKLMEMTRVAATVNPRCAVCTDL
eukprot:SAG11_NODE_11369_length_765_cov_1.543544_1_plen_235_part_01